MHLDANVLTGVAQGTGLSTSGTPGRSDAYVAGDTVPVIGFALETAAANKAPVFVIKQF